MYLNAKPRNVIRLWRVATAFACRKMPRSPQIEIFFWLFAAASSGSISWRRLVGFETRPGRGFIANLLVPRRVFTSCQLGFVIQTSVTSFVPVFIQLETESY